MANGDLIVLNGTSSGGKSTTAKALQALMDKPYLHSGPDHFLHAYHPKLFTWHEGDQPTAFDGWLITTWNNRMVDAEIGPVGRQILTGVYRAIAALVEAGLNVIVEDALWDKEVLQTAVFILHPYSPFFVGLHCSLATAERREAERGDRFSGGAATFFDRVHAYTIYDLDIDTEQYSPEGCAEMIKVAVVNGRSRTAFKQLNAMLARREK